MGKLRENPHLDYHYKKIKDEHGKDVEVYLTTIKKGHTVEQVEFWDALNPERFTNNSYADLIDNRKATG